MIDEVATVPRLLVACDFDGTLSPIVEDPAAAAALPRSVAALKRLAQLDGTVVAIVSGRRHRELHDRFGTESFVLIGEHGTDTGQEAPPEPNVLTAARRLVESAVESLPGSMAEHKSRSVVFHYRRAESPEEAVADLRSGAEGLEGIVLMDGKSVLELSASTEDKGTAIEALRASVEADAVVFLGDDVTDENVFRMLSGSDLGVKVGTAPTAASTRVADPDEVADLLERLADLREKA